MISVVMLTRNSERFLAEALEALRDFPEVLIVDNGSTDATPEIAAGFPNVRIIRHEFIGFGPLRNYAATQTRYDWIFSIDSDEIVPPELAREVLNMELDPNAVYRLIRNNHYRRKRIRGCGWGGEWERKLYNRTRTEYRPDMVHEKILVKEGMRLVSLKNRLNHYLYNSTQQFLHKMQMYSDLFAQQHVGKRKSSTLKATGHALWAFIRHYILRYGFIDGPEGWLISVTGANVVFYKYMKLKEANEDLARRRATEERRAQENRSG